MASSLELLWCSREELIGYFRESFQYTVILSLLVNWHNISVKMWTFHRILKRLKLKLNHVETCSTNIHSVVLSQVKR